MFPISQNMMESSEDSDMVSDCMNTYEELIDTNVDYDLLPMPLHHVRESSTFVAFVINGGNGFSHYSENHG